MKPIRDIHVARSGVAVLPSGIRIWHEQFGDPGSPPVLLLMGAGAQSIFWPDELVGMLTAGGRQVVRYDHRDLGGSTWTDEGPEAWEELRGNPPYSTADLAGDALGLLDSLGIHRAHFVGAWLGAVLTEAVAEVAPARVLSATLIGMTPPWTPRQFEELWATMEANHQPVESPDELIDQGMRIALASAGTRFPFEEERLRALWTRMAARGNRRMARARHVSAGFFSPRPGSTALAASEAGVLIIQGTAERGYQDIVEYAARVPYARLVPIEGMGHELPSGAWPTIAREVLSHTNSSPSGTLHWRL